MHEKSRSGLAIALGGLALLLAGASVRAGEVGLFCHCPPPLRWCSEQAPCIKFKCACPRPVCDPCDLQHYGYFLTCWHPWPFQANWTHCQTPPPGVALPLPAYQPYTPRAPQDRRADPVREGEFPAPRMNEPRQNEPRLGEPKEQMDSPQVRNTGYRVIEQPPAQVQQRQAPRRFVEEPSAPVQPAPRRLVEETPAPVQQAQPAATYRQYDAPVQQPQTNRPAVRFIQ